MPLPKGYSLIPISLYFKGNKVHSYTSNDPDSKRYFITKVFREIFFHLDPNNFNYQEAKNTCLELRILLYTKKEGTNQSTEVGVFDFIKLILMNLHSELNKAKIKEEQQLKKGDVLVYNKPNTSGYGNDGHTAMYIGGGQQMEMRGAGAGVWHMSERPNYWQDILRNPRSGIYIKKWEPDPKEDKSKGW